MELTIGAPTIAYVRPFERAAQRGLRRALARRVRRHDPERVPDERASRDTRPVGRRDRRRSPPATCRAAWRLSGPSEIETLSRSFNAMTESLRRTMAELSRRLGARRGRRIRGVAGARGSERADLGQGRSSARRGTIAIGGDEPGAGRALDRSGEPSRHDGHRSLRVARSGTVSGGRLDLDPVIAAAAERAAPMFTATGATSRGRPSRAARDQRAMPRRSSSSSSTFHERGASDVRPGGQARVSTSTENGHVIVEVTDDGRGIARGISRR